MAVEAHSSRHLLAVLAIALLWYGTAQAEQTLQVSHGFPDGTAEEIALHLFADTWDAVPGAQIGTYYNVVDQIGRAQPSHVKHAWYHGEDGPDGKGCADFGAMTADEVWSYIEAHYWIDLWINGEVVVPTYVEVGTPVEETFGEEGVVPETHWWIRWVFVFPEFYFDAGVHQFTVVGTGPRPDSPLSATTTVTVTY